MTEQVYHARGAGNGEPKCHCTMDVSEYCPFHGHIQFATRELGADTGTTPPPSTAEFEPLLRGELKHGRSCPAVGAPMDEGNCDCGLKWRIRLQTEMTLRNAWEKRAYEAEAALAAATQRAPVEQGPLKLNYVPRWNSQIIAAEVLSEMRGLDVVTCQNEVALHDAIAKVVKRATEAAAPDHAREGALFLCRYRDSEGKECGAPIALNVDSYSGFIHTEGSGWLHWASPVRYGPQDSKAAFVKRADGKEGGE